MSNNQYTPAQLKKGLDAWKHMASYLASHGTMPPNFHQFMSLPLEVTNPRAGSTRVVLIGELTPGDIQDWAESHEALARDEYLAELAEMEN